jgi:hypothetical protein
MLRDGIPPRAARERPHHGASGDRTETNLTSTCERAAPGRPPGPA